MSKFKIGDEVQFIGRPESKFVVTCIGEDGFISGVGLDGVAFVDKNPIYWEYTGRYFKQAKDLMDAVNGNKVMQNKILIDLVELETALSKAETDAEMSGKNHAYVKGLRAAKKIALSCNDALIRCKNCKHRQQTGPNYLHNEILYWCELRQRWTTDDWFCPDGERRA